MTDAARVAQEDGAAVVLTIDRGNSTLDCCLHVAGASTRRRLPVDGVVDGAVEGFIRDVVGARLPTVAIGVTAVPDGLAATAAALERSGVRLVVAGRDLRCPLRIAYPDPSTLGADRWVGACAAHADYGDALVVDCGTAVTFNIVSVDGCFRGGAIGAGLSTIAAALATRAPSLPRFDGRPPGSEPAITTPDALRIGVGNGFVAMVDGLANRLLAAAGLPGAARVLTGGDAAAAVAFGLSGYIVRPELVHEGLRWLWHHQTGSSS